MKIGIFDSGIGGITVLHEALKLLPNEKYIYFADTANVPYGTKPKEVVKGYIVNAVEFMAEQGINALVVACNTATSIAINELRTKYDFPIVGMEPAVKPAVEKFKEKRVLVTATPLTLKEEKFQNLVSKVDVDNIVDILPLPELVGFAEKFIFDGEIIIPYLREKLSAFNMDHYGTIVLGCTHFPFYRKFFEEITNKGTHIIDGNEGTVKRLKTLLTNAEYDFTANKSPGIEFYSSCKKETDTGRFESYLRLLE